MNRRTQVHPRVVEANKLGNGELPQIDAEGEKPYGNSDEGFWRRTCRHPSLLDPVRVRLTQRLLPTCLTQLLVSLSSWTPRSVKTDMPIWSVTSRGRERTASQCCGAERATLTTVGLAPLHLDPAECEEHSNEPGDEERTHDASTHDEEPHQPARQNRRLPIELQ